MLVSSLVVTLRYTTSYYLQNLVVDRMIIVISLTPLIRYVLMPRALVPH